MTIRGVIRFKDSSVTVAGLMKGDNIEAIFAEIDRKYPTWKSVDYTEVPDRKENAKPPQVNGGRASW